jgi:hypothetical protein
MPCPFTGPKMFWAGPNFFLPDQRFIYIAWQSQTFCARQKDNLHSVKLVFVQAQKFMKRHEMQSNVWAGSKIGQHKTFWDLALIKSF